jgi:hypothetical protein
VTGTERFFLRRKFFRIFATASIACTTYTTSQSTATETANEVSFIMHRHERTTFAMNHDSNPVSSTQGKRIPTTAQFLNSNNGKDEAPGEKVFGGLFRPTREAKKSLARTFKVQEQVRVPQSLPKANLDSSIPKNPEISVETKSETTVSVTTDEQVCVSNVCSISTSPF